MPGTAPYEIVVGPAEIYTAPVGTPFPAVDEAPAAGWTLLGTSGANNQSEDGVTVRTNVTSVPVRVAGSVMPRKFTITEKAFQVEVTFYDMSVETLTLAMGGDDADIEDGVDDAAFEIPTDPIPTQKALLIRLDQSPYGAGRNSQFEVGGAFQVGNPELVFRKGDAVGVMMTWEGVQLADGSFVRFIAQKTVVT